MNEVAGTIINQLGGRQFVAMTGAKGYHDKDSVVIKFKGSRIANYVTITLNVMDTYDVKFSKIQGVNIKTVKVLEGIYNDQLRPLFEEVTGLRTSL